MTVLAIDPGTKESAYVLWDGKTVIDSGIVPNDEMLAIIRGDHFLGVDLVAIEMIACYGMAVGKETFETCVFIGRLIEAWPREVRLIYRKDVVLHLCHSARAKDSNVRQTLIDRYGAPGTKKAPGRTYGIKSHLWSALAIATYVIETFNTNRERLGSGSTINSKA